MDKTQPISKKNGHFQSAWTINYKTVKKGKRKICEKNDKHSQFIYKIVHTYVILLVNWMVC